MFITFTKKYMRYMINLDAKNSLSCLLHINEMAFNL